MENSEYLDELLRLFGLGKGAPMADVIDKYLEKTLQIKFQRIIVNQDILKEEFVRLHESFLKVTRFYQAAEQKLQMGIFSPDQLGKFYFNQGIYALCKDNFLQAAERFQEAHKVNKHNVFLLVYLGIILTMRKNFYAAEKYFSEATKRDPNYDEAWFYSAENYFKAGNYKLALENYETVKRLNPSFNNIVMRVRESREALLHKRRPGKKSSLLRRVVQYFRNAFER
jgi:tetratricopeptide (TPR) repeat protein